MKKRVAKQKVNVHPYRAGLYHSDDMLLAMRRHSAGAPSHVSSNSKMIA
jgi:hypothetical protein